MHKQEVTVTGTYTGYVRELTPDGTMATRFRIQTTDGAIEFMAPARLERWLVSDPSVTPGSRLTVELSIDGEAAIAFDVWTEDEIAALRQLHDVSDNAR